VLVDTTSYPVSLSLASAWDPELMHEEASAIGDEAREVVRDHSLDLLFFAPTINLARDPRWGRNDETFGEDPYLTAALATQFVNGMEGKDRSGKLLEQAGGYLKSATTLKHFAANNSEVDRLNGSSDMDERTLREYYTAHFRDAVRASGPGALMTAYNRVNGVPATASVHLVDRLARPDLRLRGLVVSDCDAVHTMAARQAWQPPGWDRRSTRWRRMPSQRRRGRPAVRRGVLRASRQRRSAAGRAVPGRGHRRGTYEQASVDPVGRARAHHAHAARRARRATRCPGSVEPGRAGGGSPSGAA
jgi:hypothetical protein